MAASDLYNLRLSDLLMDFDNSPHSADSERPKLPDKYLLLKLPGALFCKLIMEKLM